MNGFAADMTNKIINAIRDKRPRQTTTEPNSSSGSGSTGVSAIINVVRDDDYVITAATPRFAM